MKILPVVLILCCFILISLVTVSAVVCTKRKKNLLKERKRKKQKSTLNLAFYTCFYGTSNNVAFAIPKVPSSKYACYYFTNNKEMYNKITQNSSWICVMDEQVLTEDKNTSCMQGKRVKVLPHLYTELAKYDYLCFLDSKLEHVSETFVEKAIDNYFVKQKYVMLCRQHWFVKGDVMDEFNESMFQERYKKEKEQYLQYIHKQINEEGQSAQTKKHCLGGFIIRKMRNKITRRINDMWFEHIQECGIQDQISLFFVKQRFADYIETFTESPFIS